MEDDKADFLKMMQLKRSGTCRKTTRKYLKMIAMSTCNIISFFIIDNNRVILLQAESSILLPEIVGEVQAAFKQRFEV